MGRSMIVGRGRQTIVGGEPRTGAHGRSDYDELMGFASGQTTGGEGYPTERGAPIAYMRGVAGPRVVEEHPVHPREFPIGFSSPVGEPVPANLQVGIETKPQVLFRGERLAVPNSIVQNFQIADIKVGKDSQLAAPGNMPAECFSNLSVGVRMQLDTAEPGITITLFVFNQDPQNEHPFLSVLYGTVIE